MRLLLKNCKLKCQRTRTVLTFFVSTSILKLSFGSGTKFRIALEIFPSPSLQGPIPEVSIACKLDNPRSTGLATAFSLWKAKVASSPFNWPNDPSQSLKTKFCQCRSKPSISSKMLWNAQHVSHTLTGYVTPCIWMPDFKIFQRPLSIIPKVHSCFTSFLSVASHSDHLSSFYFPGFLVGGTVVNHFRYELSTIKKHPLYFMDTTDPFRSFH